MFAITAVPARYIQFYALDCRKSSRSALRTGLLIYKATVILRENRKRGPADGFYAVKARKISMSAEWRQKFHLEPSKGWINDPNGLCYHKGKYHVYFQFSPDSAEGEGRKCWGHFESSDDMQSFDFTGIVLDQDIPEDRSGVYSGSAVVLNDEIHIFYTGNVLIPGNYDYVNEGRGANQIHVVTKDGVTMGAKRIVLRNPDYPEFCSCHVRDPKVRFEDGKWKMVLGARTKDDKGGVLFYEADDPDDWHFRRFVSVDDMGYMWECPDLFDVQGQKFLGISPQGLKHEEYRYQNVFSSGYFMYSEDGDKLENFEEFDYGFDFYAPQTFTDKNGDRVLIGWMGIGGIPYTNPTTELGWQHCLTVPRKLTLAPDGRICQTPLVFYTEQQEGGPFAVSADDLSSDKFSISIEDAVVSYEDGVLSLRFTGTSGYGRDIRKVRCGEITDINILVDSSSLEIFANGGRYVMSSRSYPGKLPEVRVEGCNVLIRGIRPVEVKGFEG